MSMNALPININGNVYSPCENCELTTLNKCYSCDYYIVRQLFNNVLYWESRGGYGGHVCKYFDNCEIQSKQFYGECTSNDECFEKFEWDYQNVLDAYNIQILTPYITIGTMDYDTSYGSEDFTVRKRQFYTHQKGWNVLRPIDKHTAYTIRTVALVAYNNTNLVYDMEHCYEVVERGIHATEKIGCNASTLIRAILEEVLNIKLPDFTTVNMCNVLEDTGYFQKHFKFISLEKTPLEVGDILVTQTKGNCVTVLNVDYE